MTDEQIADRVIEDGGEDVAAFLRRHGREMLEDAVRETRMYLAGEKTRRMAARDLSLGMYEGITITICIERVMEHEFRRLLASECGGKPEDYETDVSELPPLEAAASSGKIDMSREDWVEEVHEELELGL